MKYSHLTYFLKVEIYIVYNVCETILFPRQVKSGKNKSVWFKLTLAFYFYYFETINIFISILSVNQ